ncbi:hypothetical protein OEB59_RS25850, partial [Escherichia coli]
LHSRLYRQNLCGNRCGYLVALVTERKKRVKRRQLKKYNPMKLSSIKKRTFSTDSTKVIKITFIAFAVYIVNEMW